MVLPAPDRPRGTPPKVRERNRQRLSGGASAPGSDGGNRPGNSGKKPSPITQNLKTLNPPFDPRMRRIGSPLNLTNRIKRGWIQSAESDAQRVAFLFNPSSLELGHSIDPSLGRQQSQVPVDDVMSADYPTIGSSTGVKLLYDRTYELFSAKSAGMTSFANQYGVWADVAAWYVYMGMLPEMPSSWDDSIITSPPIYKTSYLFVGPKMAFFGWVTGISVAYSHWTQEMIPTRCAVDVSFQLLPHQGPSPVAGSSLSATGLVGSEGWLNDWIGGGVVINPDGTLTDTNG